MGIDALMYVHYLGEKPTDKQLAQWSFDLCTAIGARHFFITDGLEPDAYSAATARWDDAWKSHPLAAEYESSPRIRFGEEGYEEYSNRLRDIAAQIRTETVLAVGERPEMRRRAIEECGTYDHQILDRQEEGTYLLVNLWGRYYGDGYERGDIITYCAIAEWFELNLSPCVVFYGGDCDERIEPFPESRRRQLRRHLFGPRGRAYFTEDRRRDAHIPTPNPCSLCIPGESSFAQCGWGRNGTYAVFACYGCDKRFQTEDSGQTYKEQKQ